MNTNKINSNSDVVQRSRVVELLDLVREHLAAYAVPAPRWVEVDLDPTKRVPIDVMLDQAKQVPPAASALLRWAKTLQRKEIIAWREPCYDWVHLSVSGTVDGRTRLRVWVAVPYDAAVLGEMTAGRLHVASDRELRTWASMPAAGGVAA